MSGGDILKTVLVGTSDGVAVGHPCYFWGACVDAPGVLTLYDNASAGSGTKLAQFGASGGSQQVFPARPVWCANGIYADVTTNTVTVFYTDG